MARYYGIRNVDVRNNSTLLYMRYTVSSIYKIVTYLSSDFKMNENYVILGSFYNVSFTKDVRMNGCQ